MYSALAGAREEPQQTAGLLELVALEAYVLGELTVALLGLGVDADLGDMEATAAADTRAHAGDAWPDLVAWLKTDAEIALSHYAPMTDLAAGTSLEGLADLVVSHERALISWAERTLAGAPDALADVRALVRSDGEAR